MPIKSAKPGWTVLTLVTFPDGTEPKPTHAYCEGCWLDKKAVRLFFD